jgi:hypothetical protein
MSTPTNTTPKTVSVTTQKLDTQAQYQAIIDGSNALLPGVDPFVIAKQTIARADLFAQFQKGIDAVNATKAARIALSAAVANERAVNATLKPLRSAFKTYAQGRFGKRAPELQQLGFVQNRTPKKSVAKAAAGATQGKATRTARGTKGRQQKAAVTGAVTAVAPATPPTPATPTAPATSAPPAPQGSTARS